MFYTVRRKIFIKTKVGGKNVKQESLYREKFQSIWKALKQLK